MSADHEFHSRLKMRALLNVVPKDFSKRVEIQYEKRKTYKMLVIQNSAMKCYHEFRVRRHKDLEC